MPVSRRTFLRSTSTAALWTALPAAGWSQGGGGASGVSIRLVRNATCLIQYGGKTLLVDPFLSDNGVLPPFNNTPNPHPNPLVPLPMPAEQIVAGVDATLVTHLHVDHWDDAARAAVRKDGRLFLKPADQARIAQAGFANLQAVDTSVEWDGIRISRTGGQHGRGEVGQRMGPVCGYVLSCAGSPTIYIAGDTIWCPEVSDAIDAHRPDVIVVNAGAAQFLEGGPITMDVDDVVQVCRAAPRATAIAVHMEAVNHCVLTRDALQSGLERAGVSSRVHIPRDGEMLRIG